MEEQGLIEEVSGPTPWIVPLIAVPKANNDDLQIMSRYEGSQYSHSKDRA